MVGRATKLRTIGADPRAVADALAAHFGGAQTGFAVGGPRRSGIETSDSVRISAVSIPGGSPDQNAMASKPATPSTFSQSRCQVSLLDCSPRWFTPPIGRKHVFRDQHIVCKRYPGSKPQTSSTSGERSLLRVVFSIGQVAREFLGPLQGEEAKVYSM